MEDTGCLVPRCPRRRLGSQAINQFSIVSTTQPTVTVATTVLPESGLGTVAVLVEAFAAFGMVAVAKMKKKKN